MKASVWQAWKNWAAALKEDTYALYLASRDPRVPLAAKLVLVLVVAYALSPIDLIPDFIPVLGYFDDMLLLPMGIALAIKLMPRDVWEDCKNQARAELASELPRNRTAAIVIATVWLTLLGLMAWLAFSFLPLRLRDIRWSGRRTIRTGIMPRSPMVGSTISSSLVASA
jgi:uncharacterized membrane protein YkvA (DUF1232 family)